MESIKNQMKQKVFKETELHKSAGILDDFAIRKSVSTREINVQKSNSTVMVTDLNADLLDGEHANAFEDANANIQTHVTGTGAPHTAAGVGADAAGTAAAGDTAHLGAFAHADIALNTAVRHTQGTDQGLDTGGANAVTAAQAKTAYTHSTNNSQAHTDYMLNTGDTAEGAYTFNEAGADADFRIESDTNANMLFVDAGNNKVGIGTATPATALDVTGVATTDGIDSSEDVKIAAAKKLYLDGGGDTYIYESAGNVIDIYAGIGNLIKINGNLPPRVSIGGTLDTGDIEISATSKLYLDDTDHHSYITESSDGVMDFYTAGSKALSIGATQAITIGGKIINPAIIKGWVIFNGTTNVGGNCTMGGNLNVDHVADLGTATYKIFWDVDFGSANYAIACNCNSDSFISIRELLVGSAEIEVRKHDGTQPDATIVTVIAVGV